MIMIVVTMKKITTMIIMMVTEAFLEMVEMAMAMIMARKRNMRNIFIAGMLS